MIGKTNAIRNGGLSDTDALLRVQTLVGSTVTASKDGITKTETGRQNAVDPTMSDYYFIIPASQFDSENPWTVTATLDSKTETRTVIIDSADEYDINILYRTYLYDRGTQYVELAKNANQNASVTFGSEYISASGSNSYGNSSVTTVDQYDFTGYTKLVFEIDYRGNANTNYKLKLGVCSNKGTTAPTYVVYRTPSVNSGVLQTIAVDISNLFEANYVGVSGTVTYRLYSIYLEQ